MVFGYLRLLRCIEQRIQNLGLRNQELGLGRIDVMCELMRGVRWV